LLRAIEKLLGVISYFFDQYVYRGGHPDFKAAYFWDGDSKLQAQLLKPKQKKVITGSSELFDLKLPIAFGYIQG